MQIFKYNSDSYRIFCKKCRKRFTFKEENLKNGGAYLQYINCPCCHNHIDVFIRYKYKFKK